MTARYAPRSLSMLLLTLSAVVMQANLASAVAQTPAQGSQRGVMNGRYIVWKKSLTDFSDKADTPVSSFDDFKAAGAEASRLNNAHEGYEYVYIVVENTLPLIKAKETSPKEHTKPGDTLKEYMKRIEDAFRSARYAKSDLLTMTAKIRRNRFDEVNRLIDDYNRSRDEARNYEGGTAAILSGYPAMARVRPEDLQGKLEAGQDGPKDNAGAPGRGDGDSRDKKYILFAQKRANGRWQDVGEKRTFDDYSEFYAAYGAEKERVDEANKGLPGLLWALTWEMVSKPKKLEFQNIPTVDPGSKPAEPYNAPRVGFDDSVPAGQAGKPDAPKSSEAKQARYYVERRRWWSDGGKWESWTKESDTETYSRDPLPMRGAIDFQRRLHVGYLRFSRPGTNSAGPYEFRIVDEQGNPVGDVLRVPY